MFFTKAPTTVTGPYDDIRWDRSTTQQVDWEAELGAIIGVGGVNIRRDAALGHVFGYTIVNDVTARDLQKSHGQFFKGKSLDGFLPDGTLRGDSRRVRRPAGQKRRAARQRRHEAGGNTRDMIFPVDTLIESLSRGLTLDPGDIIATGTPEGVGIRPHTAGIPPGRRRHGNRGRGDWRHAQSHGRAWIIEVIT